MNANGLIDCPWCGQSTRLELVQSHYVCTSCKRAVLDCCDGEQEYASDAETKGIGCKYIFRFAADLAIAQAVSIVSGGNLSAFVMTRLAFLSSRCIGSLQFITHSPQLLRLAFEAPFALRGPFPLYPPLLRRHS